MIAALLLAATVAAPEALLREAVADAALAQVRAPDPAWPQEQRDCAGLVRWSYRAAFLKLAPERVAAGLWRGTHGRPSPFADAATLLRTRFVSLGRGDDARRALKTGDLLAFARPGDDGAPVMHLMIVVRAPDPAHARITVVYHPGENGAAVRSGVLDDLLASAPPAWQPRPENSLFVGYFRFEEWMP